MIKKLEELKTDWNLRCLDSYNWNKMWEEINTAFKDHKEVQLVVIKENE